MSTYNFNYNDLINATINHIVTTCENVNKYNLPDYYRNSVMNTNLITGASGSKIQDGKRKRVYVNFVIQDDTKVNQYSESNVRTQLTNYMTTTKGINLNETVTTPTLIYFYNCLVAFMVTTIKFCASMHDIVKDEEGNDKAVSHIIYRPDTNYPSVSRGIIGDRDVETILAGDVNAILKSVNETLSNNMKTSIVKYNITMTDKK